MNKRFNTYLHNVGKALKGLSHTFKAIFAPIIKFALGLVAIMIPGLLIALTVNYFSSPSINRITKKDGNYIYCDTLRRCPDSQTATYAVTNAANYEPTRHDCCIHCKKTYWRHSQIQTQHEKEVAQSAFEMQTYIHD